MTIDTSSKFYYGNGSVLAYVCNLLIHEKGIENEFEYISLKMGQENIEPWYIKLNPKGQVPTMVHKGKVFPDSFEIVVHLDKEVPTYSTNDPDAVAIVEEWRQLRALALVLGRKTPDQDVSQVEETLRKSKEQVLAYAKENPDVDYKTRLASHDYRALSLVDHETYLAHKEKAEKLLEKTNVMLENRDTVLPKGRTIADVYVVGYLYWMTKAWDPIILEGYANLKRYYQKESEKESFVRAFKNKW